MKNDLTGILHAANGERQEEFLREIIEAGGYGEYSLVPVPGGFFDVPMFGRQAKLPGSSWMNVKKRLRTMGYKVSWVDGQHKVLVEKAGPEV